MLGKLPTIVGRALDGIRPGPEAWIVNGREAADAPASIAVTSLAFGPGEALPLRHTADGAGCSPPLAWTDVPAGAAALLLVVEDADSPTPAPLVHAIVTDLAPADGAPAENALPGPANDGAGGHEMGRNSFAGRSWLPPDPPLGHGPHRCAF